MITKREKPCKIDLHTRHGNETAFIDLLVVDSTKRICLMNTVNTEAKMNSFVRVAKDKCKVGKVISASDNEYPRFYLSIGIDKQDSFHIYDQKIDDLKQVLFVSKDVDYDPAARREWEQLNLEHVRNGRPTVAPPSDMVIAYDGDLVRAVYDLLYDRYETPMKEEWASYIYEQMKEWRYLEELSVYNFGSSYDLKAALVTMTIEQLETIIEEGISSMDIDYGLIEDGRTPEEAVLDKCLSFDDYLTHFGAELGKIIQNNSKIRFDNRKENHHESFAHTNRRANEKGITGLYLQQADAVMGCVNTLAEDDYIFMIGEMGTGKTAISTVVPYVAEAKRANKSEPNPYRAIVYVPAITVYNWKREIENRIPNVKVTIIESYTDLISLRTQPKRPEQIEYYILSSNVAKHSYPEDPIENMRYNLLESRARKERGQPPKIAIGISPTDSSRVTTFSSGLYCPQCNQPIRIKQTETATPFFFKKKSNTKKGWSYSKRKENLFCTNEVETKYLPKYLVQDKNARTQLCGYRFWGAKQLSTNSAERKLSPAWYINKKFPRGFFKYLIADEVHQYKAEDSDRANAFGQLVNHTEKQILLTGTLVGGMAKDIFYLIARLDSRRLKRESIHYNNVDLFVQRYGLFENKYNTSPEGTVKKNRIQRPGISPQVFTRFLISNAMFLELADLGYILPTYTETPIFVPMDDDHKHHYDVAHRNLKRIVGQNSFNGNGMKYIAMYINQMYQYCDMPFNVPPVMMKDREGNDMVLHRFHSFDPDTHIPAKYSRLKNLIDGQIQRGRKTLVYVKFTGRASVDTYLYRKLKDDGYRVGLLRTKGEYDGLSFPSPEDRQSWIEQKMKDHDYDVMITNQDLVSVGLNLLMFPTIVYYQMDYSTYNYMQSSRRSWRIGQKDPVEIYTMVYEDTLQMDVLHSIAKKIDAALAIQGKFSEEGLRAMAENGDGMNALAKKLVQEGTLETVDSIESRWKKINEQRRSVKDFVLEGYEGYTEEVMNPLGMDEVLRIAQSIIDGKRQQVKEGTLSQAELDGFVKQLENMLKVVTNTDQINKGLRKRDRIAEGQLVLDF